jgi:hypothetical protein
MLLATLTDYGLYQSCFLLRTSKEVEPTVGLIAANACTANETLVTV